MPQYEVRRCPVCAVEFTPTRRNQIHDKPECRLKKHGDELRAVIAAGRLALAGPQPQPSELINGINKNTAPMPEGGAA